MVDEEPKIHNTRTSKVKMVEANKDNPIKAAARKTVGHRTMRLFSVPRQNGQL
jgi:hypothetical protein